PKTNGDDRDAGQVFDLIELPLEELEAAWQDFATTHIRPGRLLRLAADLEALTDQDRHHLEWCTSCQKAFQRYSPADQPVSTDRDAHKNNGHFATLRQSELWPTVPIGDGHVSRRDAFPCHEGSHRLVPSLLRAQLHVPG